MRKHQYIDPTEKEDIEKLIEFVQDLDKQNKLSTSEQFFLRPIFYRMEKLGYKSPTDQYFNKDEKN